jgi:hypothetical protein
MLSPLILTVTRLQVGSLKFLKFLKWILGWKTKLFIQYLSVSCHIVKGKPSVGEAFSWQGKESRRNFFVVKISFAGWPKGAKTRGEQISVRMIEPESLGPQVVS